MTNKNYEPGDVNILKVVLQKTSSGSQIPVDIRPQLLSLSIFEDIEEPSMVMELTMVDSINLVQDYPIVGEEMISISYFTPGRTNPTKLNFMVYSVESTGTSPTAKGSIYQIKGVSPCHYFNASALVEKSYKDTIDEIVKDIVKTTLQASPTGTNKFTVEKTKGIIPVTIPRLKPFQAIDFLRQKAVSSEFASGGSFVFYENQFGHQFKSIEGLMKEGKNSIESKIFTYAPDTVSDKDRQQYSFRNIIRYNHLGKFDSIDKINSGVVTNIVQSFDILTKGVTTTDFKLSEKAKNFVAADAKGRLPNSTEFIEKYSKSASKKYFLAKDSSRGDDYIDSNLGSKSAYASLLNQNAVRILIYGDSYLAAGDLIQLDLPEVSGTTEKKVSDRNNSGNYIITKLRHILTMEEGGKPKHQISIDCVKMGYK